MGIKQKRGIEISLDPILLLSETVFRRIVAYKRSVQKKYGFIPLMISDFRSAGHSRGLVQLLAESGFESYLFSLPEGIKHNFTAEPFTWQGFDGSELAALLVAPDSRPDTGEVRLLFQHPKTEYNEPVKYNGDINISGIRYDQSVSAILLLLSVLEHKFYSAEKLLSVSSFFAGSEYPGALMKEVMDKILFLGNTDQISVSLEKQEEKQILISLKRASEMIDEALKLFPGHSFNSGTGWSEKYWLMLVNPHPFDVDSVTSIPLRSYFKAAGRPVIRNEKGEAVQSQLEGSGDTFMNNGERVISFQSIVPAGKTLYYSIRNETGTVMNEDMKSVPDLVFENSISRLVIDPETGFPSVFEQNGTSLFGSDSMSFSLEEAGPGTSVTMAVQLQSTSIIESGSVRTIAASLFRYGDLEIYVRYIIPHDIPYFDVELDVYGLTRGKKLLWSIPAGFSMNCVGRTISGINCCKHRNRRFLFRDWLGMKNFEGGISLSICAGGAYEYDIIGNTVRLSIPPGPDELHSSYRFRFRGGETGKLIDSSFNSSDLFNNPLITRILSGDENTGNQYSGISISDEDINLISVRLNDSGSLELRLLNPGKAARTFGVEVRSYGISDIIEIGPRKIKTIVLEKGAGKFADHVPETGIKQ